MRAAVRSKFTNNLFYTTFAVAFVTVADIHSGRGKMSDDNVYEFHENEQSTFDIPDDTHTEKEPEEEVVGKKEEDNEEYDPSTVGNDNADSDDPYSSVDEDAEEKKIQSQSNSQEPSNEASEPESEEEKEEKEEEEDDDDYDPTAEVSTNEEESKAQPVSSGISATETNQQSATPTTQATSLASSLPSNSTTNPDIQQSVAKIMSSNVLSDPEFLKLSPTEQQQRILTLLGTNNNTQTQQTQSTSSYSAPAPNYTDFNSQTYPKDHRPDLSLPMTIEEISKYNAFIDGEAKYSSTRPTPAPNSRLFVGNLPANVTSKQDLFRLFNGYGHILQISIKGSYCFIQYSDAEAVERAINAERGIPFNGKDLVLEIAKKFKTRKRGREDHFEGSDDRSTRRRRGGALECQIFVKRTADPQYARDVARQFQSAGIATEYEFLKPGQDLSKKINDVAYNGILSVVLINKNRNSDVQIYEKTPDGSIRYDEYLSVSAEDATQLLLRAKQSRFTGGGPSAAAPRGGYNSNSYGSRNNFSQQFEPSYGQQSNNFYQPPAQQQALPQQQQLLQSLQNLPPSALQNLLAMAQGQQPAAIPQQQFQQPYQQPYQPQPAAGSYGSPQVDLASLLGKVQSQAQPQQQYGNQGYNPLGGNDSYQPTNYQQPPPQQSQPQNSGSNVQSLLDTLAKLQK
ncbi:unnamed protein product [Wickerhamomyces anomalus]